MSKCYYAGGDLNLGVQRATLLRAGAGVGLIRFLAADQRSPCYTPDNALFP
jgi:hypothetical protein